jgi:retron-type reverse transcriptase
MSVETARRNIPALHDRLVSHQYIPKENGTQRPISIPALEEKIVQKATGAVLNAIYEQDFRLCTLRAARRIRARCGSVTQLPDN